MKRASLRGQRFWTHHYTRRNVVTWLMLGGALFVGGEGTVAALLGIVGKIRQIPALSLSHVKGSDVGTTAQAPNSAVAFRHPHTGIHSILVRLPGGTFVAYDQRCTHSGVLVEYDPASHRLVCPAHNAIFDPAQSGRVLQGPATEPLPQIGIRIHADGTITAL